MVRCLMDKDDVKLRPILTHWFDQFIVIDDTIHIHDPTGYVHVKAIWDELVSIIFKDKKFSQQLKCQMYDRFIQVVKDMYPKNYHDKLNFQVGLLRPEIRKRKAVCVILAQVRVLKFIKQEPLSFVIKNGDDEGDLIMIHKKFMKRDGIFHSSQKHTISFEDTSGIRKLAVKLRCGTCDMIKEEIQRRLVLYSVRYSRLYVPVEFTEDKDKDGLTYWYRYVGDVYEETYDDPC